jgi:hypothetical protein
VELRGRFSNPGVRTKIDEIVELIRNVEQGAETPRSTPGLRRRWWAMRDRLDERSRRKLVEDRQAGATLKMLAQTYGVSLSSVQRLLRKLEDNA